MKGRSSLLEERVPYSGRCSAGGEDALSIGRENRPGAPLGGQESEVDLTLVRIQVPSHLTLA